VLSKRNLCAPAGVMTCGTMSAINGRIVALEIAIGNTHGVTEVRSTTELLLDHTKLNKAEHLTDIQTSGGREIRHT
jgi:hypothetical protein